MEGSHEKIFQNILRKSMSVLQKERQWGQGECTVLFRCRNDALVGEAFHEDQTESFILGGNINLERKLFTEYLIYMSYSPRYLLIYFS